VHLVGFIIRKYPYLGRKESLKKMCNRGRNMPWVILCKVSEGGRERERER
jgi:hypothetical protein